MLISLRQLLDHAAEHDYGVPAFNVNNLEQLLAVMAAADRTSAPVILQSSTGSRAYSGEDYLSAMVHTAIARYPHIPVVFHRDHAQTPAMCLSSIQAGFSSVMMDGSLMPDAKTPASWSYNVSVTRQVVEMAHAVGVSVEGELGCLGNLERGEAGKEDGVGAEGHLTRAMMLTDPEEARRFVSCTGVDALAIAIGTSHGAYKFDRQPTDELLAIDRVADIHRLIPNTHLVMHGASSVPQELLAEIRAFGGDLPETYGVPVGAIVRAIAHGVRKVNIDTDIRLAMTGAVRRFLVENPAVFDPRALWRVAQTAAQQLCEARFEAFGAAGQAEQIKALSLRAMACLYTATASVQ